MSGNDWWIINDDWCLQASHGAWAKRGACMWTNHASRRTSSSWGAFLHSVHFNFVHILNLHFLYFPSTTWKYERPLTVIQQSLAVSNLVFKFDAFNVLKEALHIFLSSHSDPFIFLSARWCSTLSRRQTSWSWNPLASGLGVNLWTVINHFIILLQLYSFQES